MSELASPTFRENSKQTVKSSDNTNCTKPVYSTIRYITEVIKSQMDIQMESLLEEMQVNWSIIESALENERQKIEAEIPDFTQFLEIPNPGTSLHSYFILE